jgi:GNAT superfamily N-acetyltransferase
MSEDWLPLERSTTPMTCMVELDDVTRALVAPFDYETDGTERFYPFTVPSDLPSDFGIGVIVGASGTGKSTLLRSFGDVSRAEWSPDLSIAAHFADPVEAMERLSAAGLMSVPDWVKPWHVLSTGQRFRADLARCLHDGAVVDEFTSVVSRDVAKAASAAMARYVRSEGVRRIVVATVHRDVLEFLEPDFVIDTDRGEWSSGRWLRRPELVLEVRPAHHSLWRYFAEHHYLSGSINRASHCYVAFWNGIVVGFAAVIAYPSGTLKSAYREHRLVILPDFQGLGFGPRLSEAVARHYTESGKRFFSKTAHPRLGEYRDGSPRWKGTSKNHIRRSDMRLDARWTSVGRWSYSHEFIG